MVKPSGGRGKTAPYKTEMVRTPVPIKAEVESLIAKYRESILSGGEAEKIENSESEKLTEYLTAIKLVDRFIESIGQTEHLHSKTRRDNRNLARFRDWLIAYTQTKEDAH